MKCISPAKSGRRCRIDAYDRDHCLAHAPIPADFSAQTDREKTAYAQGYRDAFKSILARLGYD